MVQRFGRSPAGAVARSRVAWSERFYYYPDALVTCDPRDRGDDCIKRHPILRCRVRVLNTQKGQDFPTPSSVAQAIESPGDRA